MASTKRKILTTQENWLDRKWRPAMGWMYLVVCVTDFILFPIAWSLLMQKYGNPLMEWEPLTLKGAGMFHVAMGAVVGVVAWSRGQERIIRYQHGYTDPHIDPLDPNCYEDEHHTEEVHSHVPVADTRIETEFYKYRR